MVTDTSSQLATLTDFMTFRRERCGYLTIEQDKPHLLSHYV